MEPDEAGVRRRFAPSDPVHGLRQIDALRLFLGLKEIAADQAMLLRTVDVHHGSDPWSSDRILAADKGWKFERRSGISSSAYAPSVATSPDGALKNSNWVTSWRVIPSGHQRWNCAASLFRSSIPTPTNFSPILA